MKLGTTYICTEDINKSCAFYQALLQQEPIYRNEDRWIVFACGISLYISGNSYVYYKQKI